MATADRRTFRNENLVLKVSPNVDPKKWNETRYEKFLDALCGHREYQKEAIRTSLRFLLGGRYQNLRELALENFGENEELQSLHGRWEHMDRALQLPEQMACSLDLATGTGKSYVMYGVAMVLLAENVVDRVLVLCPSNTIEAGLLEKFKELATNSELRDSLPPGVKVATPRIINASETIVDGAICVENYHAILEHVNSSIRDSLKGNGARVAVLNDEAHHVANESGAVAGRWKEFLLNPDYGFRFIVGVSGTCYVGDDYFSDVIFRFSLRLAIEERWVKRVEYVAEMPETHDPEEKWQLIWNRHSEWKKKLASRNIRPLTIIVTRDIRSCKQVEEELRDWLQGWEKISAEAASEKVLAVSSHKDHTKNISTLKYVDTSTSRVEWIVSVAMLSEGWDVKNVFQIVPHEERAFNSKLLIAQVLGRGLRRPNGWSGDDPVVTVFNHDAWSGNIKRLVNEILEIERKLTSRVQPESIYNFDLHNLDYTRVEDASEHAKVGEYKLLESGFVHLAGQVETEDVTVEFERAITGEHSKFQTSIEHKTFSVQDVAERIYNALQVIDEESSDAENEEDRTQYSKRFPIEKCEEIVRESLQRANINSGRITDDNRQKFLQALGTLRRRAAKRVVYKLTPNNLLTVNTSNRSADSCSAVDIRRASRTIYYTEGCLTTLPDEQREFFLEVEDPDGDFRGGRELVSNPANFKTPANFAIADATPERKFIRELTDQRNATALDAWLKNAAMKFYALEYAWKKGEHSKRGEFSPDFFIKQGDKIFVVEVKDDGEIADPSPENVKKYEFAHAHFDRLNDRLAQSELSVRYQFNMLSPRSFNAFFIKLRDSSLTGYRSELDVTMLNTGTKT